MTTSTLRSKIREQVQSMPPAVTYPTSWAGPQTFEQIYDNLVHYVSNVMKLHRIECKFLPDCLQNGFMALWLQLVEDNRFVAEKTRQQTVYFVLARSKVSSLRSYDRKYDRLEELVSYDWRNNWDDHTITGLSSPTAWHNSPDRWAPWANEIDMRIDIERVMFKLLDKYGGSFEHLMALYTVTTQVYYRTTAPIVNMTGTTWQRNYIGPMRQEVQSEFAQAFLERHDYELPKRGPGPRALEADYFSPYWEWREQYESGNTAVAEALLQQHGETEYLGDALRAKLEGKSYNQAVRDLGYEQSKFWDYMKRAAKMLAAAYA